MVLSNASREAAAETLTRLIANVTLELYLPAVDTPVSTRLRETARELADVAGEVAREPRLDVRELRTGSDPTAFAAAGIELVPTLLLRDERGEDSGVRFAGAVEGQELSVLLADLLALGRTGPPVSPLARDEVARIERPLELHVLGTASCPRCATAVRIAHALAMANPRLHVTGVDLGALPEAMPPDGIQTVPVYVRPRRDAFTGPLPELVLVQRLTESLRG